MVRVVVGTLIEVGRGRIAPEHIESILGKKDRTAAGPTLPAKGLFLLEVEYPD
jgi:tRNA pseudouridine38-40 synthase